MAVISLDHEPNARNEYLDFVADQKLALLDSFELESGEELKDVTVAYKTWGKLNSNCDNCLVVCHALSGSSDIEDWWGPLLGSGKAFDFSRYFIFCANVLGSPYGTTSSLSINPKTGRIYGPEFPQTTIRDDIRLHKLVLDALGVTSVASVAGGSMGGMGTLEWPLCTPENYVKSIIPISTSADHDAWGISWAEAQRQCVFADPAFQDGYYLPTPETQPASGLAAARMVAMLTYRSSPSFSTRFGRDSAALREDRTSGLSNGSQNRPASNGVRRDSKITGCISSAKRKSDNPIFTAQSYLRYQGQKFVSRFDANCFIHLTRKMDNHDVTRGRVQEDRTCDGPSRDEILSDVFSRMPPKALVVGIESDVLFRPEQQEVLVNALPDASLVMIPSPEGRDGFLLEFETLGPLIEEHLRETCPWIYEVPPLIMGGSSPVRVVKDSVFGEVESGW